MGTLASELQGIAGELAAVPRVYVDANMPVGLVAAMRQELGWDVLFVLEEEAFRRAVDAFHFHRAYDLGRTLITLDHDFLDDRRFPPDLTGGVIVCSAPDEQMLRRMLEYVDQTILGVESAGVLPLKGRKMRITPEMIVVA